MVASIAHSVGENGFNRDPDVRVVQSLLNRVPLVKGGPSIQLTVDGLCYGKTLSAIESFQRKSCGFAQPDKRIDPGGRTWTELVKFDSPSGPKGKIECFPPGSVQSGGNLGARFSLVSTSSAPPAVTAASLVTEARASLPLALAWVTATLVKLSLVRGKIARFHVYTPDEIKFFESIEIHFKVRIPENTDVVATTRIDRITSTYTLIRQALGVLVTGRLVGDPALPSKAQAPLGGFTIADTSVTIGNDFHNSNSNMRAAVLIHECAHFVDGNCSHVASELPAPNGSPISDSFGLKANPSQKNYAQMDFDLAIKNAYSFAQCAMHNGIGFDRRPP
ncbi:MAG TPA: hypothetical protein VFK05_31430 [Polyangiaceae bacterium]|nr:hypothetical protein [Polyangiaceae bacterium]